MRLLDRNETVVIEGERLISGEPDCGSAVVIDCWTDYTHSDDSCTHWGYCATDRFVNGYMLKQGMYFSVAGPIHLGEGGGCVVRREGYTGYNTFGGPVERTGRLRYIDGCTDSLLIGPPVIGDPCFNLLHFPPGIRQTMHTHPSLRCGTVVRGRGRAITPTGELPLEPGSCWFLETGGQHCFYTDDEEMVVIAWHPDTDTGPSHQDHPMLNKTMVDGVSAAEIDAIRTQAGLP